jgi:hypothetical protein
MTDTRAGRGAAAVTRVAAAASAPAPHLTHRVQVPDRLAFNKPGYEGLNEDEDPGGKKAGDKGGKKKDKEDKDKEKDEDKK